MELKGEGGGLRGQRVQKQLVQVSGLTFILPIECWNQLIHTSLAKFGPEKLTTERTFSRPKSFAIILLSFMIDLKVKTQKLKRVKCEHKTYASVP